MKEILDDKEVPELTLKNKSVHNRPFKKAYTTDFSNKRFKKPGKEKILEEDKSNSIFIYNCKDFIYFWGLLMASSFNFNFLYYPYFILGLFYILLINNNYPAYRDIKSIINIIVFIYTLLLLIFDIVMIILSAKDSSFIVDNKSLFINLGIPYALTKNFFELFKTIFGLVLLIIICIGAFIIEKICDFEKKDLMKKKHSDFENLTLFYKKVKNYLFISFFIIIGFATFNKSVFTMFYVMLFYILFFIYLLAAEQMTYLVYKTVLFLELFFIICQLLIINITNIYYFSENYFSSKKEELINSFLANNWSKFGFYLSYYYEDDISTSFKDWLGYCFGCFALVGFVFILKIIKNENYEYAKKTKKKENDLFDLNDDNAKVKIKKNCFSKFISNVFDFCSGEQFVVNLIRILAIIWVYYARSFFSILIIFWIFFSFLYLDNIPIRLLCLIILLPALFISMVCITASRIFYDYFNDLDDKSKVKYFHFNLGNYDYDLLNFPFMNILCVITIYFIALKPKRKKFDLSKIKTNINIPRPDLNVIKEEEDEENELIEPLLDKKEEENIHKENKDDKGDKGDNDNNEENNLGMLENIIRSDNDMNKEGKMVTIMNLIKKFLFEHINKITLIVMFFVANKEINVLHLILIVVFLIQLVRPFLIKDIGTAIIITFQVLFLIEYIMDLLKVYYAETFEANIDAIKFFIVYEVNTSNTKHLFKTNIEIFIYAVVYCFYIHEKFYNYDFYVKLMKEKDITLSKYIDMNIKNENIKKKIFLTGRVIKELYLWVIIVLFLFFSCFFEINFLFAIKLYFFFFSIYKYCIFRQANDKNKIYNFDNKPEPQADDYKKNDNNKDNDDKKDDDKLVIENNNNINNIDNNADNKVNINIEKENKDFIKIGILIPRIILFFSGIHTLLVYIYQVICLDFTGLKDKIKNSDNFIIRNLSPFGLTIYPEDNLYYNLLPHYILSFLSLLYLRKIKYAPLEEEKSREKEIQKIEKRKKIMINIGEEKKEEEKKEEKKEEEINIINTKEEKEEKEEEKEEKEEEKKGENEDEQNQEEEDPKIVAFTQYTKNKKEISSLNIKYFFYIIITTFTKFYWLVLFIIAGLIYTSQDLSAGIFIYIVIFGITFIVMFHSIIMKLSEFNKKGVNTYFISKVIRFSFLERKNHLNTLKYYRSISFRYLLGYSLLLIFLFYLYGVFDLIQNGCNKVLWENCANSTNSPIFDKGSKGENIIISLSYLLGFYVNIGENGILTAGWMHYLFAIFIAFDLYIQKIEFYFVDVMFKNRAKYRILLNENVRLKAIVNSDKDMNKKDKEDQDEKEDNKDENNIENKEEKKDDKKNVKKIKEDLKQKQIEENKARIERFKKYNLMLDKIKLKYKSENIYISDADEKAGRNYIIRFLTAIQRASSDEVLLSEKKSKYKIVVAIKKIFEEIIIFLLLCTSISKLNVWSILYILISIYLILSTKTMRKYYYVFCFTIVAVFAQLIVFLTNLNQKTDPTPDKKVLKIIKDTFNIPWYNEDLRLGFFYGIGTSASQINLMWMDFFDIIVMYIYMEYFSYCIYQDADNKGAAQDKNNKINFYKLSSNKNLINSVKNMTEESFKEFNECMKYNVNIDLGSLTSLKIKLGIIKEDQIIISDDIKKKEGENINLNVIIEDNKDKDKENIILNVNENINTKEENINEDKSSKKKEKKDENKNSERSKIRVQWSTFFSNFAELAYLSFHNVILIIIIVISMMVSGLLSLFYIIFSLYFLITSNRMYLGQKYFYPKAIKKILRIAIIVDIAIQIIYQMPYFSLNYSGEKSSFEKFLDIIGFNRIINYGKENERTSYEDNKNDVEIYTEQMILVFGKAVTYFFMGIQILIYSSQNFQEHYLIYLITREKELKRKSLMNAFRFNNKRISTIDKSITLREEMPLHMEKLKNNLDEWGTILYNNSKEENKDNLINIKNSFVKDGNLRSRKSSSKKEVIFKEKEIKEYLKKLLLNKFLIRLEAWFYQFSVDYSKINPAEKDLYERDVIQGKTKAKTFLEKIVDFHLDKMKLDNFTEKEMIEVKKFFTETEAQMKILEEQKIEKKKKRQEKQKEGFGNFIAGFIKGGRDSLRRNSLSLIEEKNEKEEKIDLTQPKFKEIENLIQSDLCHKYLKNTYILKTLSIDLLTYCSKKFQFICYFMMILNHIENASVISMIYPLSIFCFAIFEYPRPSKTYWTFCILYSIIVITIKYMLQLKLFVELFGYDGSKESIYASIISNLENYKIGLRYMKETYGGEFFNYIVFDALVIIFLLINNLLLIINGLWDKREQEIENIYYAMERVIKTKNLLPEEILDLNNFNDYFLLNDRKGELKIKKKKISLFSRYLKRKKSMKIEEKKEDNKEEKKEDNKEEKKEDNKEEKKEDNKEEKKEEKIEEIEKEENSDYITIDTYKEDDKSYYQRLFPKKRNEKPGNDFYAEYTIGMILAIIFIIIFYTSMVQDVTYGALSQETNQFSGSMIIFLVIHIFFLCYDRVLYISQNRNNIKYEYIIYNNRTMKQISEIDYNTIKTNISKKYNYYNIKKENFMIPADYAKSLKKDNSILYIQNEDFNSPLFQKYILHLFITVFIHAFIFIYAPLTGNYNMNRLYYCIKDDPEFEECNDFKENASLIWFYIIYMIYFIFSGMQIKFGYYDMKRKSLLKSGYSTINKTINTAFKSIPFIYEIKLAIDWAFTPTSLDLFQWNKYENVYDTVFTTYCAMKAKNDTKIGQIVGKFMKGSMGGVLSFVLVILLVLPILLFSSLNPTNELNSLNGASLKIDLSFKYESGLIQNYTLYESTKPETILDFTENENEFENEMQSYSYDKSVEMKNFPKEQIQRLNFSDTSERNWGMTKPHIKNLIDLLNFNKSNHDISTVELIIDYEFERYLPVDARKPGERHGILIYDKNDKTNKTVNSTLEIDKIREAIYNCNEAEAKFEKFYTAPVRLTANVNPREINDDEDINYLDIYLGFKGCKRVSNQELQYYDNIDNIYHNYLIYNEEEDKINSYLESFFTVGTLGKRGKEGIFFYIMSDKVSSTTSGYSVITFYVTFILLAGNYVRNFFAGEPSKITLTEMPDCQYIIDLCEGIKIARYSFDFTQEENLYYILIEFMRSPDYLQLLTKSSVEQYNNRKEMTEKDEDPNRFNIKKI